MKKSQRLKVIVGLNSENEKKALRALGVTQTKKNELQTQLDNLQGYLQEYKDKYQAMSSGGVNISKLLEFRCFISKLDKAIEDQQQAILESEKEVIFAKKSWERQHQKTKSLQKVCNSAIAKEVQIQNKREQTEQDERSNRSGRRSGT